MQFKIQSGFEGCLGKVAGVLVFRWDSSGPGNWAGRTGAERGQLAEGCLADRSLLNRPKNVARTCFKSKALFVLQDVLK